MAVVTLANGCGRAEITKSRGIPFKYRLPESAENQSLVVEAIERTNHLIYMAGLEFRPSWVESHNAAAIPVFVVQPYPPGQYSVAFIPRGERCVFLDAAEIGRLNEIFSRSMTGASVVDPVGLLMLVLLHEAGHIAEGHDGSSFDGLRNALNIDETLRKKEEIAADAFGARLIKMACNPSQPPDRFLNGMKLSSELAVVAHNLTAYRFAENPFSTALGKPEVLWDEGYSHPNIEVRVLMMLAIVSNVKGFDDMLADLEKARRGVTEEFVLVGETVRHGELEKWSRVFEFASKDEVDSAMSLHALMVKAKEGEVVSTRSRLSSGLSLEFESTSDRISTDVRVIGRRLVVNYAP